MPTRLLRKGENKRKSLMPTSQEYQESVEKLGKTLGEKSKVVAELVSQDKALTKGHTIIRPKKPISALNNDLNHVDQETWNQMGELLQESIKKLKAKISQEGNYSLHIPLGKMSGPLQEDASEIELHLIPYEVEELE